MLSNKMNNLESRQKIFKDFWEKKAKKYPLPFDDESLKKTNAVISKVKSKGIEVAGKRILDIGCGTGIYTLPLAQEALHVIGIDFSNTMLTRLQNEAKRQNISNVDVIETSWDTLDVSSKGFIRHFDIVWAAMSMAIKDEDSLKKMELCSRKWCVYIGWGAKRKNAIMEEVFKLHGLRFAPPQGASAIHEILRKMGRQPTLDFFDTSWDWEGTAEEAVEEITGHLEVHGGSPMKPQILEIVSKYAHGNTVKHTTFAEEGLITWSID